MPAWLQRFLGPRYKEPKGILLYDTVQEVILVQKMLAAQRFAVRLVAPPPEFRVGCDLAIEFELLEQEALEMALAQSGSRPVRTISTKQMLPGILSEAAFVEIDGFLMSKAGNMKITVNGREHTIVNISGGGCPDIPYVAMRLQGQRLEEAPNPVDLGNSLCSFMLQISFDALKARVGPR
jgi:hypothetical protein